MDRNPIERLERELKIKPEVYWQRRGEAGALLLFSQMAKRVPAYRDFLKKNKVNPAKVKTIADFAKILPVDKANYLKHYPLEQLCWDGQFKQKQWTFASTSGTTGEPFYFPRNEEQDRQYALTAELYLRANFQIQKKSTLYIDAFAMGAWIGGLFTYEAIRMVADKGYALSIITPGLNKPEIFNALKKLAPQFDQVLLGGYPPFIKDVIDQGTEEGINWKKYNLGIIFSAESFNERFRDYIIQKANLKNIYTSTLNHYGTVDQGTHSHETPACVLIRRLAIENDTLHNAVFPEAGRLPTLTQYWPEQFYFEEVDGNLLCSARSGIPLVRYDLKDRGGVTSLNNMERAFSKSGVNLRQQIKAKGIIDTLWQLPFVYVYERSDLVVSWYGANIYPEHVRHAHLHHHLSKYLTGKFTMSVEFNRKHDPVLHIHSELKRGHTPATNVARQLTDIVVQTLLEKNSEFRSNYSALPKKNTPKIKLWPHEGHPHFKVGGKHKWVKK